jgi:hypothetical protein
MLKYKSMRYNYDNMNPHWLIWSIWWSANESRSVALIVFDLNFDCFQVMATFRLCSELIPCVMCCKLFACT